MDFKTTIFAKYIRSLYKVNLDKSNIVHKTLIEAIYKLFVQVEEDIDSMRLEICLSTATGKWLDLWGEYFGIPRKNEEIDEVYSQRIIAEIIEPKATLNALKRAAARWLNFTYDGDYKYTQIEAYEPWKDLLVTSQRGKTSVLGRLPDSIYWTHSVVDMAIPDASEMSMDLIMYLNTIKAAGVQLTWHRTMSWEVLTGYFETDSVNIWIECYYDLFLRARNNVTDGLRTANEYTLLDESLNTPVSVRGFISGRKMIYWDVESYRELEPYRYLPKIVHMSPTIALSVFSDILGKELEDLTIGEITDLELNADDQIPNLDNIGKLFSEEIKPHLDTPIKAIFAELEEQPISDLETLSIEEVEEKFSYDAEGMSAFLENWRKHNYFNRPLSQSPLTRYIQPVQIESKLYACYLGVLRNSETLSKLYRIFKVDSVEELSNEILLEYLLIDLATGDYYDTLYYRNFSAEIISKLYGIEPEDLTPQLVDNPTSEMILNWLNYGNKFKYIQEPVQIESVPI